MDRPVYRHIGPLIRPPRTHLTPREKEILTLAVAGQRSKQIARTLWLSEHTVKNHLKSAYRILGVSDLADALVQAVARGEVALPTAHVADRSERG
jgi:DNA-binding CsgD family transcriptional regulator